MKQGDYVGWIFGTKNGKEDIITNGTILKKMSDGRYKTLLKSGSVQYFRERELRVLQSAEEK